MLPILTCRMSRCLFFVGCVACLLCVPYFCLPVSAQGRVKIIADERMQFLLNKHIEFNVRARTVQGYRVRIASFSGSSAKDKAFELKESLLARDKDVPAYVIYDDPNFIVKWGDFISRLDAHAAFEKIKHQYPNASIVRDDVHLPALPAENLISPEELRQAMENQQ